MRTIGIVPDDNPNAEVTSVEIPDDVSLSGNWYEVAKRLAPYIPDGWHLVRLG